MQEFLRMALACLIAYLISAGICKLMVGGAKIVKSERRKKETGR